MIKVDVPVVPVRRASLGLVAVSVWVQDVRGVYLALVLTLVIAVHAVRRRRVDGDIFESPLNRMPSHDEDAGQLLRPETGGNGYWTSSRPRCSFPAWLQASCSVGR